MLAIAGKIAEASTCLRGKNGCVITTREGRILSAGYNGSPAGTKHCEELGCIVEKDNNGIDHCIRSVHAELNAIINAAKNGVSLKDAQLYTTTCPCRSCAMAIVNAGISIVRYMREYSAPEGKIILKEAQVPLIKYGDD